MQIIKNKKEWSHYLKSWSNKLRTLKHARRIDSREERLEPSTMRRNSKYLRNLRDRITPEEKIVGDFLAEKEIPFVFQKGLLKPFHRIVDFYIPRSYFAIEVDGGYHELISSKDDYKDTTAFKRGIRTLRIRNEEVIDGSFKKKILDQEL